MSSFAAYLLYIVAKFVLKSKLKQMDKITDESVINGSRVFIEDGEVKTILSESIQRSGYMSVEDLSQLLYAHIDKLEKIYKKKCLL